MKLPLVRPHSRAPHHGQELSLGELHSFSRGLTTGRLHRPLLPFLLFDPKLYWQAQLSGGTEGGGGPLGWGRYMIKLAGGSVVMAVNNMRET